MRKRSKKIPQDIRPWVRVKPALKPFAAIEDNDSIEFNMPAKVKSRWVAGGKRDRQTQALTVRNMHIEAKPLHQVLARTNQLNYNFSEKLTRKRYHLIPLSEQKNDYFPKKFKNQNIGSKIHKERLEKTKEYDLFFNIADNKRENHLLEIERLAFYAKEKIRAKNSEDISLYRRYFTDGLDNSRSATIYLKNHWAKIILKPRTGGIGRNKNSCFLLGKSRTFNRKLAFARHTTRKLTAFGYIAGLKRS